jgi:hypothetical protein
MLGIPLKSIVESYLIEEGRDTKEKYLMYLHLAADGLRELEWDVSGTPKVVSIEPDNNGVATLPNDVVKVVRISVLAADGKLLHLAQDDDIFKAIDNCGNVTGAAPTPTLESVEGYLSTGTDHMSKGQFIGRYYGMGGRSIMGEFRVYGDKIYFGQDVASNSFILEYMGYMPSKVSGQFMVHPFLKEPIMAWIDYASKRRTAPLQQVDYLQDRYLATKNWARQRFYNMDITELQQVVRKNFSLTPKI